MNRITDLPRRPINVGVFRPVRLRTLLPAAIAPLITGRARPSERDAVPAQHAALGHLGLTIIALVYVLVVLWQS